MHCLEVIKKMNDKFQKQATQTVKPKFHKAADCFVCAHCQKEASDEQKKATQITDEPK